MISSKVLILESEQNKMCSIKNLLRRHGYEVEQRQISRDLISTVLKSMPHLILLTCCSGEQNGLETCKMIKEDERLRQIPIIVQLHDFTQEGKKDFLSLDVEDYIEYPFLEEELILKIKNQLKVVSLERALLLSRKALEESLATIELQKNKLENNLSLAAKIQEALIPQSLGNIPNCSFLWHFQPSGKVGGDIFDVFMLDEDHMGLYMIDVMGHGVASSMLAVTLSETLILDVDRGSPLKRKISVPPYYEIASPKEVIEYLNKRFPFTKYHHYFTIFYMILNVKTGVMQYVRAAHPAPVLVKFNGELLELDAYGTPVGFEFSEGYEERTVCLDSGDTLIVYTDGLMEIKDETGKTFEYDGIMDYLKKEVHFDTHHLTLALNKLVRSQESLKDDLSILEMRWIKFI